MDLYLSKEHESLIAEHFEFVNSKLKKLEDEARVVEIPSSTSGRCLWYIHYVSTQSVLIKFQQKAL